MAKLVEHRVRIETALNNAGQPTRGATRVYIDDEDLSNEVTEIYLHVNANDFKDAAAEITFYDSRSIGNGAPISGELIAGADPLVCVGCYVEHRAGQRALEDVNDATLIVGGNSTCTDHLQIGPAPALPGRTPGGIILNGGN